MTEMQNKKNIQGNKEWFDTLRLQAVMNIIKQHVLEINKS